LKLIETETDQLMSIPFSLPLRDSDQDEAIMRAFRDSGHRVTNQRLALLKVLREQGGFIDAEVLHELATRHGQTISLATVYRALGLFKEMNLVEGRIVGDEQDREEYRFRPAHGQETYTLACKRCGAIVPVESDIVDAFREEVTATLGVTIVSAHSCFVGYCAACTAALAAEDEED
jgi:Fur family ferric uptake transcriptional regulator